MDVRMIALPSGEVALREWGSGGECHLIFLHSLGGAASAAFFGLAAGPLVERGVHIAAPDLPGFGSSPTRPMEAYDERVIASLAWEIADHLGWDRVILVGHSWGGVLACYAATQQDERVQGLVLVDSGHLDYVDVPDHDPDASYETLLAEYEAAVLRVRDRDHLAADLEVDSSDPLVDAFLQGLEPDGDGGLVSRTAPSTRAAIMRYLGRSRVSETWPAIARSDVPVLLLLATEPPEARAQNEAAAERFRGSVPQAEVVLVDGATHSLITDLRASFGGLVGEWVERAVDRGSGATPA